MRGHLAPPYTLYVTGVAFTHSPLDGWHSCVVTWFHSQRNLPHLLLHSNSHGHFPCTARISFVSDTFEHLLYYIQGWMRYICIRRLSISPSSNVTAHRSQLTTHSSLSTNKNLSSFVSRTRERSWCCYADRSTLAHGKSVSFSFVWHLKIGRSVAQYSITLAMPRDRASANTWCQGVLPHTTNKRNNEIINMEIQMREKWTERSSAERSLVLRCIQSTSVGCWIHIYRVLGICLMPICPSVFDRRPYNGRKFQWPEIDAYGFHGDGRK